MIWTRQVHFEPLATNTPKHTCPGLGNVRSLCFVSHPICSQQLGPKCLEDINWSLWPGINVCSCISQHIITMIPNLFWWLLTCAFSWQQRRHLHCCCTGSCCSGRTGPWGIFSTTPVRANGNARRTWVVKSSTISTRARQVPYLFLVIKLSSSFVTHSL